MSRLHADRANALATTFGRPIAYVPVVTWAGNTIGTQSGFYLRLPGLLQVWVSFTETAGTANALMTITLPFGVTAVTHTGGLTCAVGNVGNGTNSSDTVLTVLSGAVTTMQSLRNVTGVVATWTGYGAIPILG